MLSLCSITHRSRQASCVEETFNRDFYVDDCLTGADDIPSAKKLINDVRCQLATKQFPLRKFVSSSAEVMESLPSELRENEHEFSAKDYSVKALGIKWIPTNDVFVFKVAHDLKENMTKRSLLSDISKIFCSSGLTPMTLPLKLIMQSSWSRGINWDDKIPGDMMETFLRWRKFTMWRILTYRDMLWRTVLSFICFVTHQKPHTPVVSTSGTRRRNQPIFLWLNQEWHL